MRERGLKLEPCIELILVRKYQLLGPFTRHSSAANQADYRANSEKRKAAVRARYVANPEIKKGAVYRAQPENKKAAARAIPA